MLYEGLSGGVTVVQDPHLWVLLLLLRCWLRRRWNFGIDGSRGVAGLLHLTAPWVGEDSLASDIAATWSSMSTVATLVDLVEDLAEALL